MMRSLCQGVCCRRQKRRCGLQKEEKGLINTTTQDASAPVSSMSAIVYHQRYTNRVGLPPSVALVWCKCT